MRFINRLITGFIAIDDPWQKAEDGMQLASEIPNAIFQGIENASHWLQQDVPEDFATALLEFFGEVERN